MEKCPKCGGEMEVKSGKWDHNFIVKAGLFGMKSQKCAFVNNAVHRVLSKITWPRAQIIGVLENYTCRGMMVKARLLVQDVGQARNIRVQ